MIKLAFVFLIMACVAGVFAFTNIAASAPQIAQILFYTFLVVFAITVICWFMTRHKVNSNTL